MHVDQSTMNDLQVVNTSGTHRKFWWAIFLDGLLDDAGAIVWVRSRLSSQNPRTTQVAHDRT